VLRRDGVLSLFKDPTMKRSRVVRRSRVLRRSRMVRSSGVVRRQRMNGRGPMRRNSKPSLSVCRGRLR
jgi:hypothetical protein